MTDSGQPPSPKFEAEDELDYLFTNASPNPNREGCPSRGELVRVSRLEAPIGDAAYTHIVRCSPCFREMRALQQAGATRRRTRMWAVAAAAVVALIAGASWWMAGSPRDSAVVAVTIDLRPFSVTRGDSQSLPPAPIAIPRARLDATIVLPLGAEAGAYEVELLNSAQSVQVEATAEAFIIDSLTTLRITIETTPLSAGAYQLAVRRVGTEPLRVQVTLP